MQHTAIRDYTYQAYTLYSSVGKRFWSYSMTGLCLLRSTKTRMRKGQASARGFGGGLGDLESRDEYDADLLRLLDLSLDGDLDRAGDGERSRSERTGERAGDRDGELEYDRDRERGIVVFSLFSVVVADASTR